MQLQQLQLQPKLTQPQHSSLQSIQTSCCPSFVCFNVDSTQHLGFVKQVNIQHMKFDKSKMKFWCVFSDMPSTLYEHGVPAAAGMVVGGGIGLNNWMNKQQAIEKANLSYAPHKGIPLDVKMRIDYKPDLPYSTSPHNLPRAFTFERPTEWAADSAGAGEIMGTGLVGGATGAAIEGAPAAFSATKELTTSAASQAAAAGGAIVKVGQKGADAMSKNWDGIKEIGTTAIENSIPGSWTANTLVQGGKALAQNGLSKGGLAMTAAEIAPRVEGLVTGIDAGAGELQAVGDMAHSVAGAFSPTNEAEREFKKPVHQASKLERNMDLVARNDILAKMEAGPYEFSFKYGMNAWVLTVDGKYAKRDQILDFLAQEETNKFVNRCVEIFQNGVAQLGSMSSAKRLMSPQLADILHHIVASRDYIVQNMAEPYYQD